MSKRKAESIAEEPEQKVPKAETDNRLIVTKTLPTLQQMANRMVVIALWYHHGFRSAVRKWSAEGSWSDFEDFNENDDFQEDHYLHSRSDEYYRNRPCSMDSLRYNVREASTKLQVPATIQKMLRKCISPIEKQIKKWISYHHRRVFFHLPREDMMYNYVDEISWRSDGCIDYLETAKQLLSSLRLNELEKFRLMCVYCLENEIKGVSPFLFSKKYEEEVTFNEDPLLVFWKCQVKGRFEELLIDGYDSIESLMLASNNVDNRWAIMYFFNRLNDQDKVNKTIQLIRKYGIRYQAYLLNQLTEVQQHQVFVQIAVQIMENYVSKEYWANCALKTFDYIKNCISETQFHAVIIRLLRNGGDKTIDMVSVLLNLWQSAPVHLKRYTMSGNNGHDFLEIAMKISCQDSVSHFELVTEILSDADADLKKEVELFDSTVNFCEKLVLKKRPILVDRFLKCFLTEDEDIIRFKKKVMGQFSITCHCANLCRKYNVAKLNEMLELYFPSKNDVTDYKAEILMYPGGSAAYMNLLCELTRMDQARDFVSRREFLSEMLSKASAATRKKVIMSSNGRTLCNWFVEVSQPIMFDFIITLCLAADEVVEFKKEIMTQRYSRTRCLEFFKNQQWARLNEFLRLYLPDDVSVVDCKIKIFASDEGLQLCKNNICVEKGSNLNAGIERNMKLFTEVFTDAGAKVKKEVVQLTQWRKFCELLIKDKLWTLLDHLMKLCLSQDEAMEYKKQLTDADCFGLHCLTFLKNEKYDDMEELLRNFFADVDSMTEFKAKIMASHRGVEILTESLNSANYISLSDKIDQLIPKADLAANVKKKILCCDETMSKFNLWIKRGKVNRIRECVATFLRKEDAQIVKDKLFGCIKSREWCEIFSTISHTEFQCFLLWCLNSERKVAEYKKSLPLEKIFAQLLQHSIFVKYSPMLSCCKFRPSCNFAVLNRFLDWYHGSSEAARQFKIRQIIAYPYMEVISTLTKKKNLSCLQKVIKWCFNDDPVQIELYKKDNSNTIMYYLND